MTLQTRLFSLSVELLLLHSLSLCRSRFTPDFTSSWVIRDLTLITERGSSFPFTLNVTLPHHMLPLCAQVVPGPSWEESFWVVTLVFTWLDEFSDSHALLDTIPRQFRVSMCNDVLCVVWLASLWPECVSWPSTRLSTSWESFPLRLHAATITRTRVISAAITLLITPGNTQHSAF